MKRLSAIFILLAILSLACSLSSLIDGGGDPASEDQPAIQSEKRCGDGICDGPENPSNCAQDCSDAEQSGEATLPPWYAPDLDCYMRETSVFSEGSPWAFDKEGNTTELLSDGQVTCVLSIQICGDTIFKQKVVAAGEECPESYHYSFASPTDVCCSKWDEAKQTGSPCNPLMDADCDGVINEVDAYPLDFTKK